MSTAVKSPLEAIRDKCLDCSGYSSKEVTECEMRDCSLWFYRFDRKPKDRPSRPLQAMRKKCLWCSNGNPDEVKLCPESARDVCSLWHFRFGKNPNLKGKIHSGSFRKHHILKKEV